MADSQMLNIRFGYGFGPRVRQAGSAAFLATATGPDTAAARYPVMSFEDAMLLEHNRQSAFGAAKKGDAQAGERAETLRATLNAEPLRAMRAAFARIVEGDAPLRERLTWFWADHFTVVGRNIAQRAGAAAFVDEAIRPNVTGRFADLLKAVVRHPAMLAYLDQHVSVGARSEVGRKKNRGLNENFARELMELHTLGVNGGYTQQDVREAAELLTGLTLDRSRGFIFRTAIAEPGAETILGKTYGSDADPQMSDIDTFLDDLARHPDTVHHLSEKLVTHFIADRPPPELVSEIAAVWQDTGGDLASVTKALVEHPAARAPSATKIKPPMAFMASVMLALGVSPEVILRLSDRDVTRIFAGPLKTLGQPFLAPSGPDGWPESAESWITPQGLAARIGWAQWSVHLWGQDVDDPVAFLDRTLPGTDDAALRFAVSAAETRADALALVFASPAFNRS